MNQSKLARSVGVTQSAISQYLRKDTEPGMSVLIKLCSALDCSLYELTGAPEYRDIPMPHNSASPSDVTEIVRRLMSLSDDDPGLGTIELVLNDKLARGSKKPPVKARVGEKSDDGE